MCRKLIDEFDNLTLIKVLELPVMKDGEEDWVVFSIEANLDGLHAYWEGDVVIAEWDEDKSLDWHLVGLSDLCTDALSEKGYTYGHASEY